MKLVMGWLASTGLKGEAVARLQHERLDARRCQRSGRRQPRQPSAHDDHISLSR
jgi:hypothetical protein